MPRTLSLVLTIIILGACSSDRIADYQTIENGLWAQDRKIEFELPLMDSLSSHQVMLSVRNTNDYPFSNLFLLVRLTDPEGYAEVDTLEYRMAAPDGTWLGVGSGNIKDNLLAYKEAVVFDKKGPYQLSIQHALRNNGQVRGVSQLEGIVELGYQIEPLKNPE